MLHIGQDDDFAVIQKTNKSKLTGICVVDDTNRLTFSWVFTDTDIKQLKGYIHHCNSFKEKLTTGTIEILSEYPDISEAIRTGTTVTIGIPNINDTEHVVFTAGIVFDGTVMNWKDTTMPITVESVDGLMGVFSMDLSVATELTKNVQI